MPVGLGVDVEDSDLDAINKFELQVVCSALVSVTKKLVDKLQRCLTPNKECSPTSNRAGLVVTFSKIYMKSVWLLSLVVHSGGFEGCQGILVVSRRLF